MNTMVTDTTPAFIEADLLPVIHNVLKDKQADELGNELLIKILLTNTPFGANQILQDAALCEAVLDTALMEASQWCALQERERASRSMGTDCNAEAMASATIRAAQALFTLADLLEAGIR
jgi:hypothetical protein